MSAATADDRILKARAVEDTVERLAPAVEALLQRVLPEAVVTCTQEAGGYRYSAGVSFPDGIGQGTVVARLFRYRERARLDIELQHNRVFADHAGGPTDRRCFMNDYVASVRMEGGATELPPDFVRGTARGLQAAVEAVAEFNRNNPQPWRQVKIAYA